MTNFRPKKARDGFDSRRVGRRTSQQNAPSTDLTILSRLALASAAPEPKG
jgi:hypothetical protein